MEYACDSQIYSHGCTPFVLSFRLVVFRLFLVSPSSLSFRFPAFLGGGFCSSVISSLRYNPPALLASLKYAYAPCVLPFCVLDVDLFYFIFSSFPFYDVDLNIVSFILSSGYSYAVSSVSVSAATRLTYDMYLDAYIRCLLYTSPSPRD